LVITNTIYVPYQGAEALRMLGLPLGLEVEVVGVPTGLVDQRLQQTFGARHYLQELRSSIRAFRRLLEADAEYSPS
jgi:hypothetical protein